MIDEMTSLTLSIALKNPGTSPQTPPASMPIRSPAIQWRPPGKNVQVQPTHTDTAPPTMSWPGAPMLKRPVLNAKPTERPVMISGVARYNTCPRPFMPLLKPPFRMIRSPSKALSGLVIRRMMNPAIRPAQDRDQRGRRVSQALLFHEALPLFEPAMYRPISWMDAVSGSSPATIRPSKITKISSESDLTSSSSSEIRSTAQPPVARQHQLLVDVLDGAHVQAPRRLHRDQKVGFEADLPGDDGLLLVAAGHRAGDGRAALAGADVEGPDQFARMLFHRAEADESAVLVLARLVALEHQGFRPA